MPTKTSKPNKQSKTVLPKLKDVSNKKIKYKYHLSDTDYKRRRALNEYVQSKKTKSEQLKLAKQKKRRLNVLRIYRKNNNKKECKIITKDMRYLDKKYLGKDAVTQDIC